MDSDCRGLQETSFGRSGRQGSGRKAQGLCTGFRAYGPPSPVTSRFFRKGASQNGRTITRITTPIIIRNGTSFNMRRRRAVTLEVPRSIRLPT